MGEKHKLLKWVIIRMMRIPWNIIMFRRIIKRSAINTIYNKKNNRTAAIWNKKGICFEKFTVIVIERKSRNHWHKECPNAKRALFCYSFQAFSYNPYFILKKWTNQKAIKPITNHISHYIPTTVFQHQSAIFTVLIKNKDRTHNTHFSSIHPHFHHKN